jgi:hypothetical protein
MNRLPNKHTSHYKKDRPHSKWEGTNAKEIQESIGVLMNITWLIIQAMKQL